MGFGQDEGKNRGREDVELGGKEACGEGGGRVPKFGVRMVSEGM